MIRLIASMIISASIVAGDVMLNQMSARFGDACAPAPAGRLAWPASSETSIIIGVITLAMWTRCSHERTREHNHT